MRGTGRKRRDPGANDEHRGDSVREIIELYERDVDRTLIAENLKLSPDERLRQLIAFLERHDALRRAGEAARRGERDGPSDAG
jgi:hypothetical protein